MIFPVLGIKLRGAFDASLTRLNMGGFISKLRKSYYLLSAMPQFYLKSKFENDRFE